MDLLKFRKTIKPYNLVVQWHYTIKPYDLIVFLDFNNIYINFCIENIKYSLYSKYKKKVDGRK